MTPKRILLLCDTESHIRTLQQPVNALIQEFDSSVSGISAVPKGRVSRIPVERRTNPSADTAIRAVDESEDKLRICFRDCFGEAGPNAEWHASRLDSTTAVLAEVLYFDLVVFAQPQASDSNDYKSMLHTVVLRSPRPVLVIPEAFDGFDVRGVAAIAWQPTSEAARAVGSALGVLSCARSIVTALQTVDKDNSESRLHMDRLARYLSHHDISTTIEVQRSRESSPEEFFRMLRTTAGADYVVMGAWGHSRALEWMLGGFTRYAIDHAPLPVWLAH